MPEDATSAVSDTTEKLTNFIALNPYSSVTAPPEDDDEIIAMVSRPWGDDSLCFAVKGECQDLLDALNVLILPERLSAIWHSDTQMLEVIWTTRRLKEVWGDLIGRKFAFHFNGTEHECEFGSSSERLLVLANYVEPVTTSDTMFRNMMSFAGYVKFKDEPELGSSFIEPRSFWISNVNWDKEKKSN